MPWIAVAFCALGLLAAHHPMILSAFARVQTDPGDTRLVNYFLEHGYRWITGEPLHASFWSPPVFFPAEGTLAYSELLAGAYPVYWLLRPFFAPDTAFQLWMIAISILNFAAAWLLFRRRLAFKALEASAGAFLVSFGASRVVSIGHQQMLPVFYVLVSLYGLGGLGGARGKRRTAGRWIGAALFSGGLVAQFYTGFYVAWFYAYALGLALLAALAMRDTRRWLAAALRASGVPLAVTGTAAALALYPYASRALAAAAEVGYRSYAESFWGQPNLPSWLFMGTGSWLYSWLTQLRAVSNTPMLHEKAMGFGLVAPCLAAWGYWRARKLPWARVLAITWLAVFFTMTVFPGGLTLWRHLYGVIPAGEAIRVTARVGILALVAAGAGIALWVRGARERRWKPALVCALIAWVGLEQGVTTPSYDKGEVRARVEGLASRIDPRKKVVFVTAPASDLPSYALHLDAIWAATARGVATVNGYSGNHPPGWGLQDVVYGDTEGKAAVRKSLRRWLRKRRIASADVQVIAD